MSPQLPNPLYCSFVLSAATETEQMEASAQEDDKEDAKPEDKKEEADTKEDTDVTEEGSGVKRQHEDEDTKGDKAEKVDPSKAPDPEEPEKFDESALKGDLEEQFKPPEDDVTITLDRCKRGGRRARERES